MNAAQVTVGQRLLYFLHNCYPQEKVSVHETAPKPARAMRYFRKACRQESHRLQEPGEGHHICYCFHPPPFYTYLVCGTILPCCLSMCTLKEDTVTTTPHFEKLTFNRFLSLNVTSYPVDLLFYAASLHLSHMYPGVHTSAFVFYRLVSRPTLLKISTVTIRAYCNHM